MKKNNYDEALKELTRLKVPVDAFFDGVLVMTDDEKLRNERLSILKRCVNVYRKFADFERINPSMYL